MIDSFWVAQEDYDFTLSFSLLLYSNETRKYE